MQRHLLSLCLALVASSQATADWNAARIDVNFKKVGELRGFETVMTVLQRVHPEARELSLRQLGIDMTSISHVMVFFQSPNPEPAIVARLTTPVTELHLEEAADLGSWTVSQQGQRKVWSNHEQNLSVVVLDAHHLGFCQPNLIGSFLAQSKQAWTRSHPTAAVRVLLNDLAPLRDKLPPPVQGAKRAEVALYPTGNGNGSLQFAVSFESPQQSKAALDFTNMSRAMGRGQLMTMEQQLKQQVANGDFSNASESLLKLAGIRFVADQLQAVHMEAKDNLLIVRSPLPFDSSMLLVGLSAIQAIGTQAEAEFDSVSDALNTAP